VIAVTGDPLYSGFGPNSGPLSWSHVDAFRFVVAVMSRAPARELALRAEFTTVGSVAPGIAARWAETIFCTPPRNEPRLGEEAFLASGRRFDVVAQGQRLAAWEWGEGPTVILVHGWGSRAGRFGALASAVVEAGFRAVAYDAPAHGRSTGRFASLPEFARALRGVADAVGPVFGLVGHSLGGAAATLALRDGLGAERVVLLAAPADVTRFSTQFADHLRLPTGARTVMRRNLEARLQIRWDELHLPTIARDLSAPALLVHDRADTDVPFADGEQIAAAWPRARIVATDNLGHRGLLRDPAVVRDVVAFLRESPER
jgi:pimeloyl-ACP methyl ester carboxylesterase